MVNIDRRLKILEEVSKAKKALRRQHEPFVLYRPWNITLDQHYVIYYPEGLFQKPQKQGPLSYAEVCDLLTKYPEEMVLQISMGECAEWLFAFHFYSEHSKLYTQEQLQRFRTEELANNPELDYLVTSEGKEMLSIMLSLPQTYTIDIGIMVQAIKRR